jgi:hypothetical protein
MATNLASETRAAAREHPFLVAALRAGVTNYAAAARFLDVEGDSDAVGTALRRYAEDLPARATERRDARVTMQSGLTAIGGREDAGNRKRERDGDGEAAGERPLLSVNGNGYAANGGSLTGVQATGGVDAAALRTVLNRLSVAEVTPEAAGVAGDALVVVVERRDGPDAVRAIEAALEGVPA